MTELALLELRLPIVALRPPKVKVGVLLEPKLNAAVPVPRAEPEAAAKLTTPWSILIEPV